ncbi:hypothetical protein PG997_010179 [Apiospora hydei]|uniref:F-box domain-containing protein n=1 Tax=Apiospora hydei TaxID=1337664 RepID=A0ABR1VYV2_9PEZI
MANYLQNVINWKDIDFAGLSKWIRLVPGLQGPSLIERMLKLPRELFDAIVCHLTFQEQARLAFSCKAMYYYVRPVMDGFVWESPPLPLLEMMSRGRLRVEHVKQAEEAAKARGHVACPWCSIIHPPLRCLDQSDDGEFLCASHEYSDLDDTTHEVAWGTDAAYFPSPSGALGPPPREWHPLILYAFSLWSNRGRDTAPLRKAAGLDYVREDLEDCMERDEWRLNWVPGHGLFVYWRYSDWISPDDVGAEPGRDCCACGDYIECDPTQLNRGAFGGGAAVLHREWLDDDGAWRRSDTQMLSGPPREIVASEIRGCQRCGCDYQVAWQACATENHGAGHWLHFTTWIYLGKDIDIQAYYADTTEDPGDEDLTETDIGGWPFNLRSGPLDSPPFAIGEIARLSGFPDDY